MSKHHVTLKDLAARLGVTVTTVSKALKDYPDIGKETKAKVKKLAKELNYQPDPQALALKQQKSNTIGLVLPAIVNFFFSNVIKGIMDYTDKTGYRLLITLSNDKTEIEKKQLELLHRNRVDGVLISLANETDTKGHFMDLGHFDMPVVMFDKIAENFRCSKVLIDDEGAAKKATELLIDKGCKKIAHIRGPQNPLNCIRRYNGYVKALKEANMAVTEDLIKDTLNVSFGDGYRLGKELLQEEDRPDGIFAINDQVGVGALYAALDLGIKVPEELKIIGFSDSEIGQVSRPSLSTVHQPGYEIGQASAKILIDEIKNKGKDSSKPIEFQQLILGTHIVERGTT